MPRMWACFSLCSVFSPKPPLGAAQLPALPRPVRRQAPDPAAGARRAQPGLDGTRASSICQLTAGRAPASIILASPVCPPQRPCHVCAKPGRPRRSLGPRRVHRACHQPPSVCLPRPTADLVTCRGAPYPLCHLCCLFIHHRVRSADKAVALQPSQHLQLKTLPPCGRFLGGDFFEHRCSVYSAGHDTPSTLNCLSCPRLSAPCIFWVFLLRSLRVNLILISVGHSECPALPLSRAACGKKEREDPGARFPSSVHLGRVTGEPEQRATAPGTGEGLPERTVSPYPPSGAEICRPNASLDKNVRLTIDQTFPSQLLRVK